MAVEVKTLRIGSHVLVGGQRVRVCGITQRKIGYHSTGKPCEHLRYARLNEVEPIQITPELLEELGFEYTSHDFGMWWQKKIGNRLCEIDECNDKWVIDYKGCDCAILYLHEAEAFLALHGVELIKE